MCFEIQQTDADKKVLDFVEKYPNSTKKNQAFFNVANYYFANQKPAYALKWYQKVNKEVISGENRKELNFKSGYSLLVSGDLSSAKNLFLPLINDGNMAMKQDIIMGLSLINWKTMVWQNLH